MMFTLITIENLCHRFDLKKDIGFRGWVKKGHRFSGGLDFQPFAYICPLNRPHFGGGNRGFPLFCTIFGRFWVDLPPEKGYRFQMGGQKRV